MRPSHLLRQLLAAAVIATPAAARAQTDLFSLDLAGNQAFEGLLGWDLRTGAKDVAITRIAAFDDGRDGFARTITVRMWNRATGQEIGDVYEFHGSVGTLVGSFRYITLATPLVVKANTPFGLYAHGFGDMDMNYNPAFPPSAPVTFEGGNGLVNYELAWFQPPGAQHATQIFGTSWGAASITFRDAAAPSAVPEPATVVLLGGGLVVVLAAHGGDRRRRRSAA
jgi:hypothetical protein